MQPHLWVSVFGQFCFVENRSKTIKRPSPKPFSARIWSPKRVMTWPPWSPRRWKSGSHVSPVVWSRFAQNKKAQHSYLMSEAQPPWVYKTWYVANLTKKVCPKHGSLVSRLKQSLEMQMAADKKEMGQAQATWEKPKLPGFWSSPVVGEYKMYLPLW